MAMKRFHERLIQRLQHEYDTDSSVSRRIIELDPYLATADALAEPDMAYEHLVGLYILDTISGP